MDWITLTIEVVGAVILLTWIVIPLREFRSILRVVKGKHRAEDLARRRESDGQGS